jgi:hypothetical protein
MVEKSTASLLFSFAGRILLLFAGLMFLLSGNISMIFIFGANFLFLPIIFIGSLAVIGCSMILNNSAKRARALGLVMIASGVVVCLLILRLITPIGIVAGFGGILAIVGGAFALRCKPSSTAVQ